MNTRLLLLLASVAHGGEMTLSFTDDNKLPGTIDSLTGGMLVWKSDSLVEPTPFHLSSIDSIANPLAPDPEPPDGDHLAVAKLTNGDVFDGTLISVTEKEIILDTGYAGRLTFRRDMVESLEINDRPEVHYSGPKSLEEWSPGEDESWTFENGELMTEGGGSIRHDIGKHPRVRISFDINWSDSARLRLFLHAASADPDERGSRYELVFQSQYAYMRKNIVRGNGQQSSTIGTTGGIQNFTEGERVRIEILQDIETGVVRLLVAGRAVADWRDNDPSPDPLGGHLHFFCDGNTPTRISRIRVTSWDGVIEGGMNSGPAIEGLLFEDPVEEEEAPAESEPSGIRLRNGDRISSEDLVIKDGKVVLTTRFKELELPVSRLRSFALRSTEDARNPELCWKPIRRAGDIRVWLGNGNRMTFEFVSFENGRITGRSQTFGEASFDFSVLTRMDFNIYRHPYESDE